MITKHVDEVADWVFKIEFNQDVVDLDKARGVVSAHVMMGHCYQYEEDKHGEHVAYWSDDGYVGESYHGYHVYEARVNDCFIRVYDNHIEILAPCEWDEEIGDDVWMKFLPAVNFVRKFMSK